MSLSILSDTNTHAYKYTVVKLDDLSFVSTRGYSLACAHCSDRRDERGRYEHKHGLYKNTDASFSLFKFLFYLVF